MEKKSKVLVMAPNMIGFRDGVNRIQPGHGIGSIAGRLRDRGHEVFIRDTALEGYDHVVPYKNGELVVIGEDEKRTADYIKDVQPDWIAVSILFSNLVGHGKELARIAKQVDPEIKTILGGNHVNHTYGEIIRDPNIDYIIKGECDFTLERLVSDYVNGKDISKVPGIVYMKDGQMFVGENIGRLADPENRKYPLDILPKEAREIMNMEGYFEVGLFHSAKSRSKRVGNVMASRGCPEECTFCTTPQMWGNVVRWRSPQRVYEEIKELKDAYKVEEIQFDDDTLTSNRKVLLELCDLIEPLGIQWCTPNGVKVNYHTHDPEKQAHLFKRMYEGGCYQITFAVESGDQEILDNLVKKRLPLKTVKPTIEAAKKAGMLVHTFWMVGFPGETYEQMEQTIRFAEEIESDSYSVAITTPLPGTPLYNLVRKQGLFVEDYSPEEIADQILFSKALIKVDGFSSPKEFEQWVHEKNIYLNSLLLKRDPARYELKYGTRETSERMLRRQT